MWEDQNRDPFLNTSTVLLYVLFTNLIEYTCLFVICLALQYCPKCAEKLTMPIGNKPLDPQIWLILKCAIRRRWQRRNEYYRPEMRKKQTCRNLRRSLLLSIALTTSRSYRTWHIPKSWVYIRNLELVSNTFEIDDYPPLNLFFRKSSSQGIS